MTATGPQTGHAGEIRIVPLTGIGEVQAGNNVGALIADAMEAAGIALEDGDIVVVSSKVVSKAAGLRQQVDQGNIGADKQRLVLEQSRRVVAERAGELGITRVVHSVAGPVMAAAGIDASNTGPEGGVLLLPSDPDTAAAQVAEDLAAHRGVDGARSTSPRFGLILSDTSGRPWRLGQSDFALGAWGVAVLDDLRGATDGDGRDLTVTARALADQLASAADLVKGKVGGVAAALIRGLPSAATGVIGEAASAGLGAEGLTRSGPDDWFAQGRVEAVRSALGVHPGSRAAEAIGVPALGPEPVLMRVQRAIALTTTQRDEAGDHPASRNVEELRSGDHVQFSVEPSLDPSALSTDQPVRVTVTSADPYLRGLAVARLEVALAAEALAGPLTTGVSAPVVVTPSTPSSPATPEPAG